MYCMMSVHVKEPNIVEIPGELHYRVPHCHTTTLVCKTQEIIIC